MNESETVATSVRKAARGIQRIGQRHIAFYRDVFRPDRLVEPGRRDDPGRIGSDGFQALAQHLAALPEGGAGYGLQGADAAGQRVGRGVRWTMLEVIFGGGTKAEGGTSKRMRDSVRQPQRTPRRP